MTAKRSRHRASRKDPGGRPPKVLTAEQIKQIEALAGYGLTEAAIAAVVDMSPRTFRNKKQNAAVFAALERGKAKAEGMIGQALYKRAVGGDIAAIRWWEMTRAGRSEVSKRVEMPIDPATLSMDQLQRIANGEDPILVLATSPRGDSTSA